MTNAQKLEELGMHGVLEIIAEATQNQICLIDKLGKCVHPCREDFDCKKCLQEWLAKEEP